MFDSEIIWREATRTNHYDADNAWVRALAYVSHCGIPSKPRGNPTLEVLNHTIIVNMARPVVTINARELGYRFMPAEAAWILSGDDRVETIKPYSSVISRFSDDGERFFGAYGPKIVTQVPYVIEKLREDCESRQAVINIWRESPPASKDVPCTLSCQFLLRDNRLHLVVTMRSSDLWLGVPYDVFNFSMLGGYVLRELRLIDTFTLGYLYNTAASRHLYRKDMSGVSDCIGGQRDRRFEYDGFNPYEFESGNDLVNHLWALARRDRNEIHHRWMMESWI